MIFCTWSLLSARASWSSRASILSAIFKRKPARTWIRSCLQKQPFFAQITSGVRAAHAGKALEAASTAVSTSCSYIVDHLANLSKTQIENCLRRWIWKGCPNIAGCGVVAGEALSWYDALATVRVEGWEVEWENYSRKCQTIVGF